MWNSILKMLSSIWKFLKKVYTAVVNFIKHLVSWFKNKYRQVIKKHPNVKPIALKIEKELASGNYNEVDLGMTTDVIVNTFYDESTGEILEDFTEVIEYENLDRETQERFGEKDMLVIK